MVTLVLTLLGSDRAGLVSSVSQVISERGGTWQRSQMAHLADTFAGIVEVGVPAAQLDAVLADIEGLGAQGLRVSVERTSAEPPPEDPGHRLTLRLVGADRPGIIAEISTLLAEQGVNVEELSTGVSDTPMAGGSLFEADAVLVAPPDTDTEALRTRLEDLADELMVDLDLHDLE